MTEGELTGFHMEAAGGMTFANVMLTFGVALEGFLLANPPKVASVVVLGYGLIIVMSSFLAALFYANVQGNLRLKRLSEARRAMWFGNAFTEYLGLFPVFLVLPTAIYAYTTSNELTAVAVAISVAAVVVYHSSKFDLLSRWAGPFVKWIVVVLLCFSIGALAFALSHRFIPGLEIAVGAAGAALLCALTFADIWFITATESEVTN